MRRKFVADKPRRDSVLFAAAKGPITSAAYAAAHDASVMSASHALRHLHAEGFLDRGAPGPHGGRTYTINAKGLRLLDSDDSVTRHAFDDAALRQALGD
jgi:hypothetical protein